MQPGFRAQMTHLPPQPTVFVGREDEIAGVMEMLADSHCRLLTLVGEGGIGKSRLAIEVAERSLGYYPDGIKFVDLQAIYTSDAFLQVMADALNCPLAGHLTPFEQLLNFLREKDMLLLLDNFEQLLPEQSEMIVSDLLNGCAQLTILLTSREVLNLRQEWVWRVTGLTFPQEHTIESPENYDAVRLFTERARHVRSDFLIENDLPHILHICQLVEGMPLALELAAGWLKVLPCKAIAEEIRQNLDFLNSHQRDLPARHRSIRAVFEQCWSLLSPQELSVINRLSIFKGGFRREAAEQVAGATLETLLQLTNRSLLRLESDGRFHIHELVRQYAAEQIDDVTSLLNAHCAYYAGFLRQRHGDLFGGHQLAASEEIAEELENIRAAWKWAVEQNNAEALSYITGPYALFCQFRGRYLESQNAQGSVVQQMLSMEATPETNITLLYLLSSTGWMHIRLGQLDQAEVIFQQCEAICMQRGISPTLGYASDPTLGRAVAALVRGNYVEAERLAKDARDRAEASPDGASDLRVATRTLAEAYLRQGKHDLAQHYAWTAYQLCDENGDRWFMAYCLTTLGELAIETEAFAAAKKHFESAYGLRHEMRDPEGMALVLAYLGDLALREQSFNEALQYYDESRTLYQQISDPGGLARALTGLSRTHLSLRYYQAASKTCQKALQIAVSIQYVPVLAQLLVIAGELCYEVQDQSIGLDMLTLVANHVMADHASRVAVQNFLTRQKIAELPSLLTGYDLQSISCLIQMATTAEEILLQIAEEDPQPSTSYPRTINQPLLDPLSQRELEVLSYIAAGLQNREIADKLVVSLNTVKTHINNIYSKLGVTNRVQAVTRAREMEML